MTFPHRSGMIKESFGEGRSLTMKKELTPRKRQALEMRAKIQSAALTLFNREGFENVSV